MERQREGTKVDFNFTPEQQERFNAIYEDTKKLHPELVIDEASKSRVRVLIAYTVINGDIALEKQTNTEVEEENIIHI